MSPAVFWGQFTRQVWRLYSVGPPALIESKVWRLPLKTLQFRTNSQAVVELIMKEVKIMEEMIKLMKIIELKIIQRILFTFKLNCFKILKLN